MPRLKLTQPGWTTLTGPLHTIDFVNGLSGIVTANQIKHIAANIQADVYQDDGTTRIGVAGEASDMIASKPTRPASPSGVAPIASVLPVGTTVYLTQAAYDALPVKDPNTLYAIVEV